MSRLGCVIMLVIGCVALPISAATQPIGQVIEQLRQEQYQGATESLQQLLTDYQQHSVTLPHTSPSTEHKQTPPFNDKDISEQLVLRVHQWQHAWQTKQVDAYLAYYAPNYAPKGMSHNEWQEQRRQRLTQANVIKLTLTQVKVELIDATNARVRFHQDYASDKLSHRTRKTLDLKLINQQWLITAETTS